MGGPGKKENLKPFKKGKGKDVDPRINIKGKKKGVLHSKTRLRRLLELVVVKKNPITGKDEEFSVLELMDNAMIIQSLKGDQKAYREVMNRLEGRAVQSVDQNLTITNPVIIDWGDDNNKANAKAKRSKGNR